MSVVTSWQALCKNTICFLMHCIFASTILYYFYKNLTGLAETAIAEVPKTA